MKGLGVKGVACSVLGLERDKDEAWRRKGDHKDAKEVRILIRLSAFDFRISSFWLRVSGFEFRVSCFGFRVSSSGLRGVCVSVFGFGFQVRR